MAFSIKRCDPNKNSRFSIINSLFPEIHNHSVSLSIYFLGKEIHPPLHCGKVDCMFHCSCSKDALKLTSTHDNKIGIAAEGLRSSSFR